MQTGIISDAAVFSRKNIPLRSKNQPLTAVKFTRERTENIMKMWGVEI